MITHSRYGLAAGLTRVLLMGLGGAVIAIAIASNVEAQPDFYPDLVADEPEQIQAPQEIEWQGENFLGIRFDGFVTNVGAGALHVQGNPQPSAFGSPGAVAQHILDGSASTLETFPLDTAGASPAVQFENSDDHEHWHLMRIMEYSLWDATKTEQVTVGSKIGFCLWDIEQISGSTTGVYDGGGNWCAGVGYPGGGPNATYLEMGVSPGWRDIYNRFINLQWIDVSDVAPGVYYLAALADPTDIVRESDETNNDYTWTDTQTIVPGYSAQDVVGISAMGPVELSVSASAFGTTQGALTFEIAEQPSHGTLSVGSSPFTSAAITYTPTTGYTGTDTFTYYAYDSGSDYPSNREAHTAVVTIDVDTSSPPPTATFDDVPDDHLFVEAITWMASQGISLGCGDGTNFCPDDRVTRAQIASFFARAFGLVDGAGDDLFGDDDGNTHEANIDALATAQITLGCATGRFCPEDDITRGQFASLLVRATGMTGGEGADAFTDDDGNTHEQNIDVLAHNAVTSGCTATTFCPEHSLTRGQLAQLLFRAIGS